MGSFIIGSCLAPPAYSNCDRSMEMPRVCPAVVWTDTSDDEHSRVELVSQAPYGEAARLKVVDIAEELPATAVQIAVIGIRFV